MLATLAALVCLQGTLAYGDDWQKLWVPNGKAMPAPTPVIAVSLGTLGTDLEQREWQMVATRYHQIYYQPSIDPKKVAAVFQLIDNIYDFLAERGPAKADLPVQVYLVPGQEVHSGCSAKVNGVRTGADSDVPTIVSGLLQEETHLFNAEFLGGASLESFLGAATQGWWGGDYSGLYFQERARLTAGAVNFKTAVQQRMTKGPMAPLGQLDSYGRNALFEGLAAMYFFDETFGVARLKEFRKLSLTAASTDSTGRTKASAFEKAFGKTIVELDRQWRVFYGWPDAGPEGAAQEKPIPVAERLKLLVNVSKEEASVQDIVREMARQAGLKYDFEKSARQTSPDCRRLMKIALRDKPFQESVESLLKVVGLRFELEGETVVLFRK